MQTFLLIGLVEVMKRQAHAVSDGDSATPWVERGAAAHWPAVRKWDLDRLARRVPAVPVTLVVGDRELGETRFEEMSLPAYLRALDANDPALQGRYLKEFDLLHTVPELRNDLRAEELFPRRAVTSSTTWIGPVGARTGLHHDLLDNTAVQLIGCKRFRLLPPGSVTQARGWAARYDKWARLSVLSAEEVIARTDARDAPELLTVDLDPGDVLHVPAGWWHEVENLSPGVLLSGFHGFQPAVGLLWARESARHAAHLMGLIGRKGCTCHPVTAVTEGRSIREKG
jgi:hypothetical protein